MRWKHLPEGSNWGEDDERHPEREGGRCLLHGAMFDVNGDTFMP